jgi:predicted XRE-type DNA-binding protein
LEEVEARALKRAVALQLATLIEQQSLSKADMALRMKTSRAAVDRMLDGTNPSMTLATLEKAARALGQRIKLELIPA